MRERLPLAFAGYDCGTYACLSGWYGREHGIDERFAHFAHDEIFGTTDEQANKLFMCAGFFGNPAADHPSPEAYAELERRMEYLAGLIREAGGTVPGDKPNYTGIPDSVRALFAEKVA